jgi:hypothetical protein
MKIVLNLMSQTKQSTIYKRFEKLDQGCLLNLKNAYYIFIIKSILIHKMHIYVLVCIVYIVCLELNDLGLIFYYKSCTIL